MVEYRYKALFINVATLDYRIEEFRAPEILGPIDLGIKLHLERYSSWKYPVFDERNVVVIGKGPFTGGKLMGTHRLIFIFRSPVSGGLHVSALGGAAYKFMRTGVDAVVIEGKSKEPTITIIRGDEEGRVSLTINFIDINKLFEIYNGYKGLRGVYAFTQYLIDSYWDFIKENNARALVVGPAALNTIGGAIFSIDINIHKKSLALGAEDSASRGGAGSVLYKAHGVVAIIAGGKFNPSKLNPKINDLNLINKLSNEVLGKPYAKAVVDATVKYRFDEKMGTGGTFGVNYPHYKDLIPTFGFNMVYFSKYVRTKIYDLIMTYFWKPFNDEVFVKSKSWYTCGEPCAAACKKVWRGKKVDYEPFNGLGPMIGVFDLNKARELVDLVDELGLDAIEVGHIVSWLFDAINKGLLEPQDLGLSSRPYFEPADFRPEYSIHNAELAKKIIEGLIKKENYILRLIAERGVRAAAKELDKLFSGRVRARGIKFEDLIAYAAFGDSGYMTPNYYWTPGMIAPLFILGRYWTYYTPTFTGPEEFAQLALLRAIKEYEVDNAGVCRFHRRWAEKLLPHLYRELLGIDVDLDAHTKEYYAKVARYAVLANAVPTIWESRKAMDIISSMASELDNREWVAKFNSNFIEAMREWWSRFYRKISEELGVEYAEAKAVSR